MKKVIILLLIVLIIPTISLASDLPNYVGAWVEISDFSEGGTNFTVFQLAENHKAFFLQQMYWADHKGYYEGEIFTWVENGNDSFKIVNEDNKLVMECTVLSEDKVCSSSGTVFHRYESLPIENNNKEEKSAEVTVSKNTDLSNNEQNFIGSWVMNMKSGETTYLYTITFFEDMRVSLKTLKYEGSTLSSDHTASGDWSGFTSDLIVLTLAGNDFFGGINDEGLFKLMDFKTKETSGFFYRCPDLSYLKK